MLREGRVEQSLTVSRKEDTTNQIQELEHRIKVTGNQHPSHQSSFAHVEPSDCNGDRIGVVYHENKRDA